MVHTYFTGCSLLEKSAENFHKHFDMFRIKDKLLL